MWRRKKIKPQWKLLLIGSTAVYYYNMVTEMRFKTVLSLSSFVTVLVLWKRITSGNAEPEYSHLALGQTEFEPLPASGQANTRGRIMLGVPGHIQSHTGVR